MIIKTIQDVDQKMWAYFSPDGYIQFRSLALTPTEARDLIAHFENKTWTDYEQAGFFLRKVNVRIEPIPPKGGDAK